MLARARGMRLHALVPHADCCELHLASSSAGDRQILLWPFDRPTVVSTERRLAPARPRSCLHVLRELAAAGRDALAPLASGADVDVVPYQLAPAMAVRSGACRILLADEVGLGKTIQAGWIVADALTRDPSIRVLLAVPAAVRRQWVTELALRFDVHAADVDARWLREAVADLPADINPWTAPGVYVVSLDFLKRPDIARSVLTHAWDLLVVDEAHTATAPTERHAALDALSRRARRLVLITATPYSGDTLAFQSLLALGSCGEPGAAPPLLFRRFRADIGDARLRRHRIISVRLGAAESRLQRLLARYSRMVWRDAPATSADARLAITILRKRALSSPVAAARSLRRRFDLLSSRAAAPLQLSLFEEDTVDDDVASAVLGAPGLADTALEVRSLQTLVEAADVAAVHDSKLGLLQRLLRRTRGESAIVFTEYRDTLVYLAGVLPPSRQLHGGLSAAERAEVQRAFNREGGLLLATDAAAEGLNLQGRCRLVINYELPWNPGRLEQRIGRVDRIGQRRTVHAISLIARDTSEDLVVANLLRRLDRVAAAMGSTDPLAAFLDETRVARLVITGEDFESPSVEGHDSSDDGVIVRSEPLDLAAATRIARQVKAGRPADPRVTVVSAIRAGAIAPGVAIAFGCNAVTADGDVVAMTARAVHVPADTSKPVTAANARHAAVAAMRVAMDARLLDTVDPSISAWLSDACRTHHASIDAQIDRERILRAARGGAAALQPGLFDRRALDAAEQEARIDDGVAADHDERLARLERGRSLVLTLEPWIVLIAWH